MSAVVIWIDSSEAKIFKLGKQGVEHHHVKPHGHKHPSEPHGKHNTHHAGWDTLFKDTSKVIQGATEILILGPGEPKTGFKAHLEKHHAGDLAKHIVGVETVDHPSDNQIIAMAKKFFKEYDLFTTTI